MKCNNLKIDLQMFNDKDFFMSAFEEANVISTPEPEETPSEVVEAPESDSNTEVDEIPSEQVETSPKLSKEEIERMYKEYFGEPNQETIEEEPELDEQTQSALELYKYLEANPHLVQAMREVDSTGYQQLNQYVPDEITRELNELKSFVEEQRYEKYISDLKSKYNDFDEDKVLEYAEKHDTVDLELAYKAMRAETVKEPDIESIKEQVRKEIMEELKNNSINTQSIIGGMSQKPIIQNQVNLSSKEVRIAKAMGLSPEEYAKWR